MSRSLSVEAERATLAAFAGAVLLGGANFVAVRLSNRELEPLWGAGGRFAVAAAVFGLLVLVLRLRLPSGRVVAGLMVYGLLAFAAAYGLLYWGMQEVPAGVAAVVMAAGPLLTLLLATAHGLERLHVRAVVGGVVAVAGSALMFLEPAGPDFGWVSLLAVFMAATCASESVVVVKRLGAVHPVVMNFVGMGTGSVVLLAVSALTGEHWAIPARQSTALAVGYLVASSVLLFVLVLLVIRRWTASASSYVFVLMPFAAVLLGAVLADEPVTAGTVLGGLVVLVAVYLGAISRPRATVPTRQDAVTDPAAG